jgi:quinoprotein glucose dehydrogenase
MRALTRRLMLTTTAAGVAAAALPFIAEEGRAQTMPADTDWTSYGGNLAYHRYKPLDQINAANFDKLEVAWQFKTDNLGGRPEFILQGTPLLIKGRLYCTAGSRRDVVCIDAANGELIWVHRMDEGTRAANAPRQLSGRGVGYWTDGTVERIIYVTVGYRMVSLDAATGNVDTSFGTNGIVDLKQDDDQDLDLDRADIGLHTAPTIARNVIIIGAAHTAGNTPKVQAALDLPHHPAEGRVRLRHLAQARQRRGCRQHRRLGADQRRRGTGPGLSGCRAADRRPDGHLSPGQ